MLLFSKLKVYFPQTRGFGSNPYFWIISSTKPSFFISSKVLVNASTSFLSPDLGKATPSLTSSRVSTAS